MPTTRALSRAAALLFLGAATARAQIAESAAGFTADPQPGRVLLVEPGTQDPLYVGALTESAASLEASAAATTAGSGASPCGTGGCTCAACQAAAQQGDLKKAIAGAYAPLFYNNNFAYLDSPNYCDHYCGDHFKQVPIGDCWLLDFGGQYRARFHAEQNMRGLGLTGNDDDFLLHRTRIFANAKYSDWLRVYAEYIDAAEEFNNFPPRPIEVNRSDLLNLFADARMWDGCCGDLWFRIGRQELLYGSERLISPLDWANTRRTFEGFKFLWQGEDWNIDVFATRPVIVNPVEFDSADEEQEFFGTWATYKGVPNNTYDLFAVQYNNDSGANNYRFSTLGGRWLGSE
ncbi:MAG: alginate export family protein, partial [Pirellulaceae bacterium]|nr:alginate export family protein [Pirellulaceae bacterium]